MGSGLKGSKGGTVRLRLERSGKNVEEVLGEWETNLRETRVFKFRIISEYIVDSWTMQGLEAITHHIIENLSITFDSANS